MTYTVNGKPVGDIGFGLMSELPTTSYSSQTAVLTNALPPPPPH